MLEIIISGKDGIEKIICIDGTSETYGKTLKRVCGSDVGSIHVIFFHVRYKRTSFEHKDT